MHQNEDIAHLLREILAQQKALNKVLIDYIARAEKEVPEYLRRLTMYYSDLFHAKYLWEDSGHQLPPILRAEVDRVHHRIEECIEEESMQGGTFHQTIERYRKEGRSFADRRRE